MTSNKKYQKILEKAVELCHLSNRDETLYGDSFVEIGERVIRLIDPRELTITSNQKEQQKIYGKSILETQDKGLIEPKQNVSYEDLKDALDDFVDLIEIERLNKCKNDDLISKAKKLREAHLNENLRQ